MKMCLLPLGRTYMFNVPNAIRRPAETMRRSAAQPRSSFALEGSIVVYSSNSTDSTVVSKPSIADIQ